MNDTRQIPHIRFSKIVLTPLAVLKQDLVQFELTNENGYPFTRKIHEIKIGERAVFSGIDKFNGGFCCTQGHGVLQYWQSIHVSFNEQRPSLKFAVEYNEYSGTCCPYLIIVDTAQTESVASLSQTEEFSKNQE